VKEGNGNSVDLISIEGPASGLSAEDKVQTIGFLAFHDGPLRSDSFGST